MAVITNYALRRTVTIRGESLTQYKWTNQILREMPISDYRMFCQFWDNRDYSVIFNEKPIYQEWRKNLEYKSRSADGLEYVYRFR